MTRNRILQFAGAIIAGVLVAQLWPHYKVQIPATTEEAHEELAAEIASIPVTAPLTLITEPNDGYEFIKKSIADARKSLDLVIYELEDPGIEQLLAEARARGVQVRVILQNVNVFGAHPNQKAYDFLKEHNIPVIWAPKYFALTHQKTLIVDGEQAYILTFNLVPKYYETSRDFGLINNDPLDIAAIQATFNADWAGKQHTPSNGHDLVWSPGAADTLLEVINSATKTLDIYALEVEDDRINEAMKHAASRGVQVRLNMTYSSAWKDALNKLDTSGVVIRTFPSSGNIFIHAKVIVADSKLAYVGSQNFSTQSLDRNRELGMLITRPNIISSILSTFETDWVRSRPFGNSAGTQSGGGGVIKKSSSGICHRPGDSSYERTQKFTPYNTIDECLTSGGRLPASYSK